MVKLFLKNKSLLVALLIIALLTCIQVAFEFLIPTFMGYIISIVNDPMRQTLLLDIVIFSFYMVLAAIGSIVLDIFISWISSYTVAKVLAKMRHKIHKKIFSFSSIELNQFGVGSLITRTTSDITVIDNVLVTLLHNMSHGPLLAIGALTFLIINGCNYELILVIVVAIILLSVSIFIGAKLTITRFNFIEKNTDCMNSISKENLDGLRVIRAYNAESYRESKFNVVSNEFAKNDCFVNKALGLLTPLFQFIAGLVTLAITLISAFLIKNPLSTFTYEQMAVIIQFGTLLLSGLITIVIILALIPRASICVKRVNEVLSAESTIKDGFLNKNPEDETGGISFENVSFTYPNGKAPSIQNINFHINKGETIAFIGATGSGKTLIVKLLLRQLEPQKGKIFIGNTDISHYSFNSLHKLIGWVPQKSFLFHDTIKNNICLGRPKATCKEIRKALEISQSIEFIKKKKGGINYQIAHGGKNISGGQKQRLCIARAILSKPEILVLDDSFSALDYKTVKLINSAIRKEYKNMINVIVSQRVSAIMHADKIVVLDKGKIIGQGSHKSLLKTCRVYRDFATIQLNREELAR